MPFPPPAQPSNTTRRTSHRSHQSDTPTQWRSTHHDARPQYTQGQQPLQPRHSLLPTVGAIPMGNLRLAVPERPGSPCPTQDPSVTQLEVPADVLQETSRTRQTQPTRQGPPKPPRPIIAPGTQFTAVTPQPANHHPVHDSPGGYTGTEESEWAKLQTRDPPRPPQAQLPATSRFVICRGPHTPARNARNHAAETKQPGSATDAPQYAARTAAEPASPASHTHATANQLPKHRPPVLHSLTTIPHHTDLAAQPPYRPAPYHRHCPRRHPTPRRTTTTTTTTTPPSSCLTRNPRRVP